MEYIQADEYIEVTPQSIRLRKIYLNENERRINAKKIPISIIEIFNIIKGGKFICPLFCVKSFIETIIFVRTFKSSHSNMKKLILLLVIVTTALWSCNKKNNTQPAHIDRLQSILLGKDTLQLYVGQNKQLPVTITPSKLWCGFY